MRSVVYGVDNNSLYIETRLVQGLVLRGVELCVTSYVNENLEEETRIEKQFRSTSATGKTPSLFLSFRKKGCSC